MAPTDDLPKRATVYRSTADGCDHILAFDVYPQRAPFVQECPGCGEEHAFDAAVVAY